MSQSSKLHNAPGGASDAKPAQEAFTAVSITDFGILSKPDKLTEREATALFREARKRIQSRGDNFSLMNNVLRYCPWLLPYSLGYKILRYDDWLRLLGENWMRCRVVTPYAPTLRCVLGLKGPLRPMMDISENAIYDALPKVVTVYRGCYANIPTGACWTLNEQLANWFAFWDRSRVETEVPVVVRARVRKSQILAIKHYRHRLEVITFSARIMSVKTADEAAARAFGYVPANNGYMEEFVAKFIARFRKGSPHPKSGIEIAATATV